MTFHNLYKQLSLVVPVPLSSVWLKYPEYTVLVVCNSIFSKVVLSLFLSHKNGKNLCMQNNCVECINSKLCSASLLTHTEVKWTWKSLKSTPESSLFLWLFDIFYTSETLVLSRSSSYSTFHKASNIQDPANKATSIVWEFTRYLLV